MVRRVEETKDAAPRPSNAIVPVWHRTESIAGLQCQVVGNSDVPKLIVIIAHGYGANYDDFVEFGRQLIRPLSADQIPVLFIFPNAILPFPGGSSHQRAWWPIDFQSLFAEVMQGRLHLHVPPGLDAARASIVGLIDALKSKYALQTKNFVLGGFSQGAMLTTDVSLHLPEPPSALLILSGTFVAESVWKPLLGNRKGLRVIQQHGTSDPVWLGGFFCLFVCLVLFVCFNLLSFL